MLEKPIIFSTPMVQAILEGRKTMTRRVIKGRPELNIPMGFCTDSMDKKNIGQFGFGLCGEGGRIKYYKPPFHPGDILWVRETWQHKDCNECPAPDWPCAIDDSCIFGDREYLYAADDFCEQPLAHTNYVTLYEDIKWRPSIHMPRSAARIFLRVTDVRVERVQDISEADAIAEGFDGIPCSCDCVMCSDCMNTGWQEPPAVGFMFTWETLNAKRGYGWDVNPWVWVYDFGKVI